jgi:hypothetical protein
MEAAGASETFTQIYQTTRSHIPADSNLHSHRPEDFKPHEESLRSRTIIVIIIIIDDVDVTVDVIKHSMGTIFDLNRSLCFLFILSGVRLSLLVLRPLLVYCTSPG